MMSCLYKMFMIVLVLESFMVIVSTFRSLSCCSEFVGRAGAMRGGVTRVLLSSWQLVPAGSAVRDPGYNGVVVMPVKSNLDDC